MGVGVLVIGGSGTGKSSSLRGLGNCGIVNVIGKALPFKGGRKALVTDDAEKIMGVMARCEARSVAIDDAGYILTNYYMRNRNALAESGKRDGYKVFSDAAEMFWRLVLSIRDLPDDKIVYVIMHEDVSDAGMIKPKTVGKMLDEKVCLEGMFSIVLRSFVKDGKWLFRTRTDGSDVCKSPMEMFGEAEIENDLGYVDKTIREYYGLNSGKEEK
jgi:hypothetical protein